MEPWGHSRGGCKADDWAGGGQLLHGSDVLFTRAQRRGRRVGLGVCQRFDYVPEGVVGMT